MHNSFNDNRSRSDRNGSSNKSASRFTRTHGKQTIKSGNKAGKASKQSAQGQSSRKHNYKIIGKHSSSNSNISSGKRAGTKNAGGKSNNGFKGNNMNNSNKDYDTRPIGTSGRHLNDRSSSYTNYDANAKPEVYFNAKPGLPLKVIPLGGLGEIGKNMTAFEYGNDMIIVDVGMSFPEENMPGVDCVIPDYTYVRRNQGKLRGILLTHGHEDHIGSLPYFLREFQCPIYGGTMTIELVRHKLQDRGVPLDGIKLTTCKNGDRIRLGNSFEVEFIRVNHSIADSYCLALRTPVGTVVHSGDFKIDFTPINGKTINLQRLGEIGKEGVLLFMCESTNVEIEGFSASEKQVGEAFSHYFRTAEGRIIVATFSSHVHRMQQIISAAEKYGRHICLSGRSMVQVFGIADSLGYLDIKPDTLIDINAIDNYDDDKIVILTTGSQAEPMSALTRMAFDSHRSVDIQKGDTIIISADPIPGNEKPIYRVINELYKKGAHVIYQSLADVHVSGHAYRSELMMLHTLIKPKYMVPVHGEYRMLCLHKEMAVSLGMHEDDIFVLGNGDVLSLTPNGAKITDHVPAQPILIDGTGTMDANDKVLNDRIHLSEDGVVSIAITVDSVTGEILCNPSVNSIGCFDSDENREIIHSEISSKCETLLKQASRKDGGLEAFTEKRAFREQIKNFIYSKSGRRPMIISNISHVDMYGDDAYYGDR